MSKKEQTMKEMRISELRALDITEDNEENDSRRICSRF